MTTTTPAISSTIQAMGLLGASDATTRDAVGLAQDFDSFLSLLTTQLKNQDPLAPMDSTQFTTQLVQFSQVEQSINTNARLDQLVKLQSGSQAVSAVSFVGKAVEAFGDAMVLSDGAASYVYKLPHDVASATITIKDGSGKIVRTITGAPTAEGKHVLSWDGKDDQGNALADGTYTFSVDAKDSEGAAVDVTTAVAGTVLGVTVDKGTVVLDLGGGQLVRVTDVFTVTEPPQPAAEA
ncbi:MAG TPA: flagellar hook assembly protein FlgD [Acidothermaceae bacterium]